MKLKFWIKAVLTAGVAVTSLFLLQGKPASAMTVHTYGFESDDDISVEWKWDYSDGARFDGYAKLVNIETGEPISGGWHTVDGYLFYFEKGGYVYDQYHDGYYLGTCPGGAYYEETEPLIYHWEKDSTGWKYVTDHEFEEGEDTDLKQLHGDCFRIDGKVYWFDEEGYLYTRGWHKVNDELNWIYVERSGRVSTGWKKISKKWYFFDYYNGTMADYSCDTSPIGKAFESFYAFNKNGVWIQGNGWKKDGDGEYVYLKNGRCVTGWFKDKGKWYYLDPCNGGAILRTYYVTDGDADPFYIYSYVDGYYLDINGVCRSGGYTWHTDENGSRFGKGNYYEKDSTAYIDEFECEFDSEGYLIAQYNYKTGETWIKEDLDEEIDDPEEFHEDSEADYFEP